MAVIVICLYCKRKADKEDRDVDDDDDDDDEIKSNDSYDDFQMSIIEPKGDPVKRWVFFLLLKNKFFLKFCILKEDHINRSKNFYPEEHYDEHNKRSSQVRNCWLRVNL
jgi:hypothetical protein